MEYTRPWPRRACTGSDRQTTSLQKKGFLFQLIKTCPKYGGRGHFIDHPCPDAVLRLS